MKHRVIVNYSSLNAIQCNNQLFSEFGEGKLSLGIIKAARKLYTFLELVNTDHFIRRSKMGPRQIKRHFKA
jgi:hypothetical protein